MRTRINPTSTHKRSATGVARFKPNSRRWLLLLASFALASCLAYTGSGNLRAPLVGRASTSEAALAATQARDGGKTGGAIINYVALGDSLAAGVGATSGNGYVPSYQQLLAADNNAMVNLTNLGVSGMTSANLLDALQTDKTMRTALQNAQVITFNIGGNDLLAARAIYKQNQTACGGVDNQDCLRAAVTNFKANWNAIISEILSLRANANVQVRAIDLYNPFVDVDMDVDTIPNNDGGLNDFQVFKLYLDDANNHIRATTLTNGIALGRVYRSFNGVNGDIDAGLTYGLIAADGFHPNNAGHAIIAERLRSGRSICLQPQQGLTAWYRAENDANDATANGNHAALENGASFIAGKVSQAFDFDGVDDSVLLPSINLGQSYTIEMWIKPAATQTDTFVHLASNDESTFGVYGALGLFTNSPGSATSYSLKYRQISTGDDMITASIIPPSQWSHVALTQDNSDGRTRLYINGTLATVSPVQISATYNNPLRLGHRINGIFTFYKGQIDEPSLYNRALSPSEIQAIVNADAEGKCLGSNLQISPTSATINLSGTQQFTAIGGTPPFTFSIPINHTHAFINSTTGLYSATNQAGTDTVRVTDAAGFTADAQVTVTVPCGSEKIWTGGGTTNDWSDPANWTCNQVPTSSNVVFFDGSVSSRSITINVSVSVAGIMIRNGYSGTITKAPAVSLTVGASGYTQPSGSFIGGSGNIDINGRLSLAGGTFTASSNTTFVEQFVRSGAGVFNHNNGTVVLDGASSVDHNLSSITFNNLTFNKSGGAISFLNGSPTILGTLTLMGGQVSVGTLDAKGAVTVGASFSGGSANLSFTGSTDQTYTNNGGPNLTGAWTINKPSGKVVLASNLTLNNNTVFTITSGTLDLGASFNLSAGFTTIGNGGALLGGGGTIDINQNSFGLVINAGGTFRASSNMSFIERLTFNGGSFLHNNGTVVLDGANSVDHSLNGISFFNLIFNKTGGAISFLNGSPTILGTLTLMGGQVNSQVNEVIDAQGDVIFDPAFGGGIGWVSINGNTARTITFATGVNLLNLKVNAPVTVQTSGTGTLNWRALTLQAGTVNQGAVNFVFSGAYAQSGGAFNASGNSITFNNGFSQSNGMFTGGSGNIDINGVFSLTGGTFTASSNTTFFERLSRSGGSFLHNNGTVVLDGASDVDHNLGGLTFSNLTFNKPGSFTSFPNGSPTILGTLTLAGGVIAAGGTLDAKGNVVVGAGFSGGSANLSLTGSTDQTYTNNGGPNLASQWTINKSGGTLMLNTDLDVSNSTSAFSLTSGTITTGAHVVNLGTRSVSRTSGFVIGNLRQTYPGGNQNVTKTYHVGTAQGYSPVTVQVPITAQSPVPLTVGTVQAPHPLLNPATALSFYWSIAEGTGLTANLMFNYPQAAVNGNEASYRLDRINNNQIQFPSATISTSANTATVQSVTDVVAAWTLSETPPPLILSPPSSTVGAGTQLTFTASGGVPPYTFSIPVNNSGATLTPINSSSVRYTAGATIGATDTVRVTDNTATTADATVTTIDAFKVINTNDSGPGSLRQALINADATPGTQTVSFDISGTPPFTINLSSELRANDSVIIDGTSQPGYTGAPIVRLRGNLDTSGFGDPGIELYGSNSAIKGMVISKFLSGIVINANNCVIQGNYIGTDFSGNVADGNAHGISIRKANNLIGGTTTAERNVISGNHLGGIVVHPGAGSNNVIKGNYIGVGADGVTPLGVRSGPDSSMYTYGIELAYGARNNLIGGIESGAGNRIAFYDYGVYIIGLIGLADGYSVQNTVRGNSIFSNGSSTVVFPNDACDTDDGNNRRQNFPDLTTVTTNGSSTTINGTLNSTPDKTYTLDFYANPPDDTLGGKTYLGSTTVTTAGTCSMPFVATLPVGISGNDQITATATDPDGNTSGFSPSLGVAPANINGTVRDESGQPMQGVRVKLTGTNGIHSTASTDKNGKFSFKNVPLGASYTITPTKRNFTFTPASRTYDNLSTSQNDLYVGAVSRYTISGQVTLDGASLSGVMLTLSGASSATTSTDSSGNYTFSSLLSGSYTVTPTKANTTFTPSSASFQAIASNRTANFSATSPLSVLQERMVLGLAGSIVGMNANGSGMITLLPKTGTRFYIGPTFSFDGSKIDFNRSGSLMTSNADGSGVAGPIAPIGGSFTNSWSPDGTRIVFFNDGKIYIVNSDGSGTPTLLTNGLHPAWSPDGTRIAFLDGSNVFSINVDGSNLTQLTNDNSGKLRPKWSPDGSKIVFIRIQSNPSQSSIVMMNADGSNQTAVVAVPGGSLFTYQDVEWSPDGSRLAFIRQSSPHNQIVSTLLDGSDEMIILDDFDGVTFDWGLDSGIPTPLPQRPTAPTSVNVQSGRVSISFASITANGTTKITPISPASVGTMPAGLKAGEFAYKISTTAAFTPPATICIQLPTEAYTTPAAFANVSLLHDEAGTLVDRTTSRDFNTRTICAEVTALGTFVIAEQIDATLPSISGLVVDQNGQPLNDIPISLSGDATQATRTDSEGYFSFVNLAAGGNYIVQPTAPGYRYDLPYQSFLSLSDEATVVFTATRTDLSISGRVLDENGDPVSGVQISLEGSTANLATTDSNGYYAFTALPANGFFAMTPSKSDLFFTPPQLSVGGLADSLSEVDFVASATPPTAVTLESFSATGYDNGVLLDWKTGFEVNNLGFRIYRQEGGARTLVNQEIVAGSALVAGSGTRLTAGRAYAYWVDARETSKDAAFWLEEIDLNGTSTWHGPVFAKVVGGKPTARSLAESLSQVGHTSDAATHAAESVAAIPKPPQFSSSPASLQQASLAASRAVKIGVKKAGWYRVTQAELIGAGLDPKTDPRTLRLFADGIELPITVAGEADGRFDPNDTVEFYGLGLNTASTDTRVYWLVGGSQTGLRINKAPAIKGSRSGESFSHTVERRDRTIYFSALRNGDEENFFGPVIGSTAIEQKLTLDNLIQQARESALIEVSVQGVTNVSHRVSVRLNGSPIAQLSFNGQAKGEQKVEIPHALLREGENIVALQSTNGASDISLIEAIRITYQHSYHAANDALEFTAQSSEAVTISGFSSKAIRAFDVTDEHSVQELAVSVDQLKDGYAATVTAPSAAVAGIGSSKRRLLVMSNQKALAAASLTVNSPSHWREAINGGDYVIISRASFADALKPLIELHSKQGLNTALVDVEDIYDEFSFGDKSPDSIKDFLAYAMSSWKVKPRFVLFAGDASYDARNYLGLGDYDLVPSKLIATTYLETASDDWFADFDNDGIGEIAVGRLPARSAEELAAMVAKTISYDRTGINDEALLVADTNDGFDFEQMSSELRSLLPSNLRITQLNRGQVDAETARRSLIAAINRKQMLVNYAGHGSTNQWRGDLLTNDVALSLRNQHLPMFVMMTCLNGYVQDAAADSLAESLMKAERGAIAVWASSGMTLPAEQAAMNKALYRQLFNEAEAARLGEAVRRAKAAASNQDIRRTWILLGDPALRLK